MSTDCKILVINPGSTSTKVAVFNGKTKLYEENIEHSAAALKAAGGLSGQLEPRLADIHAALAAAGYDDERYDVVVARGCPAGIFEAGAYEINESMAADCLSGTMPHPMSLGPVIAYRWARKLGVKAYNYDVVRVDELTDIARISGSPLFERSGASHTLNTKAVAREVAEGMGKRYDEVTFIMCHMGGGIGVNLHRFGRIEDVVGGDEGTFSPMRAGRVPFEQALKLLDRGEYSGRELNRILRTQSGLAAYLGTNDCREVERRISEGDGRAKLIYDAMLYQTAKDIGSMAAAASGKVDRIVITGGIAYSSYVADKLREMVSFIAPVVVRPGAIEMEALAYGALRVFNGEEEAHSYPPEKRKGAD